MYSGCRHGGYALILLSSMAPAPAWGQQFFGGDPLAGVANATLMVSFMQHVESLSQPVDYGDYGGLHQGIDVWEDTGDSVFSPNTSQALAAIVVDVDPYYGQILLASQNCLETEAIMLAHLVEIDPALDTGDELEPNTFLGLVDGGVGHLHVDYYRDFSANLMFDNCPDAPGGSFFTEEGNEERKHYLRNPLIHALQTADWAEDPDTEPCHPKAVASVHYATDSLCYVALARASDQTQRASFFGPTWCKTGIYRMEFLVDGEIEDEWTLDSFEKKDGALATAADFYLDPDAPPEEPCNRYNEPYGMLRYFLRWDTPYSGMDHDFRLIVYDAAGNSETKYLSDSDTVNDPMVEISTETVGSMVRLCWTLPGDWQIDHFNLSRGREGNQIDSCANEAPIPRHDTSGRVITHHCYEDPFPEGDDWVCLFYTLTATWVSGETTQIGRARVLNPLHCVTRDLSVYPNPFADTVEFRFVNSGEEHVHVSVYDVGGRLVKEVLNCRMPEGPASVYWDGTDAHGATVSPGVYFVGVASGRMTEVAKITLVR